MNVKIDTQAPSPLAIDFTKGPRLRVYLIGVAGSGMSGIAGLLLELGHTVSGSDRVTTLETERLERLGLQFYLEQRAEHVREADLVIYSSAVKPDNPAYAEAARLAKPLIRRADALACIMAAKKGVVVAGTHGKTTTSSMVAHVLRIAGLRPSHYVGAEIPILGKNAHWDSEGELFVAEGDESDGTLRNYSATHAIILNIEEEHLDYYKDLQEIEAVFRELSANVSGHLFYCADDPVAARLFSHDPRAISFGLGENASYYPTNICIDNLVSRFDVVCRGSALGAIKLGVPGAHNISNAMAAVAIASELGVPIAKIAEALDSFRGAKRRIEIKYHDPAAKILIVDDYGHHPTEIRATLRTIRPAGQRVRVIFQPHRFSRTLALKDSFATAFDDADEVLVSSIYPASEKPIEGVTGALLSEAITATGHPSASYEPLAFHARLRVGATLMPGDVVLTLGAGDIHEQGAALARDLHTLQELREHAPRSTLRLYEPIGCYTTFKAGGRAQFYAEPAGTSDLAALIIQCVRLNLPLFVLGRGSNLLVRDGGIAGLIVRLVHGEFSRLDCRGDLIEAGAGVRFKQVAAAAKAAGLGGFEWMDGIPGSVGGGLRMNAGAMGTATFDQVVSVRTMDRNGRIHEREPGDLGVAYRHTAGLETEIALSAVFRGVPADAKSIQNRMEESFIKRKTTQPIGASAGCIFKNPPGDAAGRLIDISGLKNKSVGAARVSDVHANFIVNDGGATAGDILALIEEVRRVVRDTQNVELRTEVQIAGTDSPAF